MLLLSFTNEIVLHQSIVLVCKKNTELYMYVGPIYLLFFNHVIVLYQFVILTSDTILDTLQLQ